MLVVKRIYYINIVIFIVQNACNRSILGADPDTFKTGGEGLNYGAEMTKEVLLRCKRINIFIV